MKRPTRRTLIVVGSVVALILALLILLPVLFGGRIAERVKAEANRSLEARVDWRDAGLGLFRNFPNLTLRLDDLSVLGVGRFDGDTLAAVRELRVVLDLVSAVRGALGSEAPIVVRAVELDRPRLSLVKLEDGSANWDVTREDTSAAKEPGARPLAVSLRRFAIEDGLVAFENRQAKLQARVVGLDQTLAGDFGNAQLTIETRVHADSTTAEFAGIPYLNGVRLDLGTDIAADLAKKTFTLQQTGLRLNELVLAMEGSVAAGGENLGLDLRFGAPDTDFRHILSLVPAVYAREFDRVQTTGSFSLSGRVKGEYGEEAFPSFALEAKVDDATFRYPDLPLPARDINLDLAVSNPGGDADSTVVNLERLHVVIGRNPIDAALVVRTPVSDPMVDARVNGTVDLADLRRTLKLERTDTLAGTIAADAAVRTRLSWVDQGQYDRVAARGTIDVRDVAVRSEALPHPMAVREASLRLAPERAELRSFSGTVGSSDLRLSGSLENYLGFALRDEALRGSATLGSNRFDLNEWRSDSSDLSVIPVPPNLDFAFEAKIAELLYDKLTMRNARGRVRVKDERATLENFTFSTLGGEIGVTGFYETTDVAKPTFDVGLRMQSLEIPAAVEAFNTVRLLAPVARYAQGNFSTDVKVSGALGTDMMPVYEVLTGQGSLQTSRLVIRDFPALERLADVTKLDFLSDPTFQALRSRFQIREGRLHVEPFNVPLGSTTMQVSGSNGLDQSLDYLLRLQLPRSVIGQEANQALAGLMSRAAAAGLDLGAAPAIELGVRLTGTVTNPSIATEIGKAAGSVAQEAGEAVREAAEQRVEAAVDTAKQRVAAEVQRLVAEAEQRAATIRAEAQSLAEKVKGEGYQQADSLVARASGPLAQAAANLAADRLRKESDNKAAQIMNEANQRAEALVAEARKQAGTPP
ncbi:MAG TPA: AsmA-like C-terminal region-containing protein [Gemmatimonadales bacterium]